MLDLADAIVARYKTRQDWLAAARTERATNGNFDGVGKRLRKIGKLCGHFVRTFEIVLWRSTATVVFDEVTAIGNAQQCVVGFVIAARTEVAFIGRDNRNLALVGEVEKLRFNLGFFGQTVALNFDIQPIAENLFENFQAFQRAFSLLVF